MRNPLRILPCVGLLVAGVPFAHAGNQSGVAPLVRPAESPPDDDAKGRLDMSEKGKKSTFSLKAQRVTGAALEAFLEDAVGSDNLVSIGMMAASLDDPESSSLKFDGAVGLPLAVSSISELSGRRVELQSGGTVYLSGVVPALVKNKGGGWDKGKRSMVRLEAPADEDAKGVIEIRTKAGQNRDRLIVKAQRVDAVALSFSVFLEDAIDSGVFVEVGAMAADEDGESAALKFDTWQGDPLPLGALTAADLAGLAIEVRGSDAQTYLRCVVPAFHEAKKKQVKLKADLDGLGDGRIETRSHASSPDERLEIKGQADSLIDLELFMESPEDGLMALVAVMPADGGSFKYKVSTKSGAPLPFSACTIEELAELAVEVRESGSGTVLLSGFVPSAK